MSKAKLPTGWSRSRIGDVVEDRIEQGLPGGNREFTYVDISAVDNRRKEIVQPKVLPTASAPSRARQQVKRDDVLVSTTRPNLNAVALVPPQLDGAIASTGFAVLRPVLLEPRWLFSVVQSEDFVTKMSALVKGSLYPAIRPGHVRDYVMPVPPLAEQERITSKLTRLLQRTRNLHEVLETLPALIQQYRMAVLEAACTGRLAPTEAELARKEHRDLEPASALLKRILVERRAKWEADQLAKLHVAGEEPKDDKWKRAYREPASADGIAKDVLPKGWSTVRLEQIAWSAGYGTSVKCSYEANGPPVLRIPNIKNGQLELDDLKFAENEKAVSSETPLEPADFIIIRTNGSRDLIGTGALIEKQFASPHYFASYLIRYRLVSESFHPTWLKVIWASPSVRERVLAMAASTTGQYNVSLGNLNNLDIPLPPLKEQKRIVAEVERRLRVLDHIVFQVKAALEQTARLRISFFDRALSGKLVEQNSSDEPASELLSRIRKFKDELAKKPKVRAVSSPRLKPEKFSMLTLEDVKPTHLADILRQYGGPLDAKTLWKESQLTIDDFYAQLKKELGKSIKETGDDRLLEAKP